MIEFNARVKDHYHIHYSISMACNNRCSYCHVLDKLDNTELFDREMFELVISKINEFKEKNPQFKYFIFIKGGEPLLVIDRVIEFMERVNCDRTTFFIFSNFNFKPMGSKIKKLLEYSKTKKFSIICSVHESSNHKFVKENIKIFRDIVEVHLLLSDKNVDFVYDYANWMINVVGKRPHHSYVVHDIRTMNNHFRKVVTSDYTNERVKFILDNSDANDGDVIIGDEYFTAQQSKLLDFKNISKKYWTICNPNQFDIGYNGNIKILCEYPHKSHISDGLETKQVLCTGYTCVCGTDQYKQLLREREKK